MGIVLRGLAAPLGNPLLLAIILAALGLWLSRVRARRAGAWLVAAAAGLAYLSSTALVGNALIAPLERQYPPFDPTQVAAVRDIVVLGSGYEPRGRIPVTGAIDADGLTRAVEGVRLARLRPGSRLLLSGGAPPGFTPSALGYAQLADDLGVQRSALVVLDRAQDTEQEAREVAAVLGNAPFILVTSAYHMPRAMQLMRRAGANPVPAPTGQLSRAERFGVLPGARGLRRTEAALHEYLGLAAIRLRLD